MTAISAGRLAAELNGINSGRIVTFAAALAATIGAIGGILATAMVPVDSSAGFGFLLSGFAAAMLGGMGSPLGAIVGGMIVGVLETLAATYAGASLKDAAAFAVILAVLFLIPGRLCAPGAGRA
jgi:branched-chain amino acid transport system permease protein